MECLSVLEKGGSGLETASRLQVTYPVAHGWKLGDSPGCGLEVWVAPVFLSSRVQLGCGASALHCPTDFTSLSLDSHLP